MPTPLFDLLRASANRQRQRDLPHGECQSSRRDRCTLCFASRIGYAEELAGKQKAVAEFWEGFGTGVACGPIITSPEGRQYRTVSKRKAFLRGRNFALGLIGVDDETDRSFALDVGSCAIEPASHAHIYAVVQETLQKKEYAALAPEVNYVIVKGNDREAIVILNLNHFSSANRREVNNLSKTITHKAKNVTGIHVFVDEQRSRYYLSGAPRKDDRTNARPLTKIHGVDGLLHTVGATKFLYSPLSFTQTNHSILESFTQTAREMLSLIADDHLYDLYCGYGLFSLTLAQHVRTVTAVEMSRSSINDGIANAKRNKAANVRFHSADISAESLVKFLPSDMPERTRAGMKVLLDPPRAGVAEGVIDMIGAQRPAKVLHIFCNTGIIGQELKRWKKAGYRPTAVRPTDMFPGTGEMEMMVLLEPAEK